LNFFLQAYPDWQSNPALVSHYQNLASMAGVPMPTQQTTAGAPTLGVPARPPGEGSTGMLLAPQGMQQIPSGQTVGEPILPRAPQGKVVTLINETTGETQNIPVPANAEIRTFRDPTSGQTESVLVNPTTGAVIQRYGRGVTVHVAPAREFPNPSELTLTERGYLADWMDPAKRGSLGPQTQEALWDKIKTALRRTGVAVPDTPPAANDDWFTRLRAWWQGVSGPTAPATITPTTQVPAPGAPQYGIPPGPVQTAARLPGIPPVAAAQPTVGAPPIATGQPSLPAQAVGAPPVAPATLTADISALTRQFPPAQFNGRQKRNPQTGRIYQTVALGAMSGDLPRSSIRRCDTSDTPDDNANV
jgi:hypothetical protein